MRGTSYCLPDYIDSEQNSMVKGGVVVIIEKLPCGVLLEDTEVNERALKIIIKKHILKG